ncbi:DUF982 domain-containing protein [Rhizobium sp. BK376]|uniref:DUF982 domain-containing protein n=1 Tax=Rhizobium sp. BK376 TaxID=2512149 RepID=UPI001044F0DA|nr:DUF982 domain-containing protein [Rhizobium sp. BK376]TCR67859.1 uncharacterized protein DUF982 [Rhizobium sp. BK376]
MSEKWDKPIEVGFGVSGYRTVTGPFDAMIVLTDLWPKRSGQRFIKARNACRAAIAGRIDVEDARREFLAAAEEAELSTH